MKVLIVAAGTHGDVLPFVALAREFQQRGHEQVLFASGNFARLAAEAGVRMVEVIPAEEYTSFLKDKDSTDPIKSVALLSNAVMQAQRPCLAALQREFEPGRTLVVGSSLAWATRLFGDVTCTPVAAVHLAPTWFRSEYMAPAFGPLGHLESAPRFVKRWLWKLIDRRFFDPLFTKPFNQIRAEFGLPPLQRMFHNWVHEAELTLAMFPDWFAAPQPDWPQGVKLTGFPLYDHGQEAVLPPEVEAFLQAGDAPIAFTAGTANASSHAFFDTSVQACVQAGRRGLLITQDASQLPAALPSNVQHFRYVPFKALLPRLATFVHHGGIGTTSQALMAGVPQLIRPMAFDQFDNASRTVKLGVARQLMPRRYRAEAVARMLNELIGDADLHARCRQLAQRMAREPSGVSAACDALLTLQRQP